MASTDNATHSMAPDFMTMDLDTVTIKVDQADIVAYKTLLTAVSDYFRNAFDGQFREADERCITLEGTNEQTFRMFLQWLYTQSLQFDTSLATLEFDALLPPHKADDIRKVAATNGYKKAKPSVNTDGNTEGIPLFDKKGYRTASRLAEVYHANEEWQNNTVSFFLNLTELFVFADKYSVPQLRDDILTAIIGQCWKWRWFPDANDEAIILSMATKLPASSKLKKFLACCIVWLDSAVSVETMMRSLWELDPYLTFEVGVLYAVKAHDSVEDTNMSIDITHNLTNACTFHDHTHLDQDQCRNRIASQPHVFRAILDACAKSVMRKPEED